MRRTLLLLTLTVAMLLAYAGVVIAQSTPAPDEDIIPGRYIVLLEEDAARDTGEAAEEAGEDEDEHPGLDVKQVYGEALKGYSAEIPDDEVEALRDDPEVESVVPDRVDRAFAPSLPTGVDRIEGDLSSTKSGDGAGTVDVGVAVIDTGIDLDHPDLDARHGTNAIAPNVDGAGKKLCAESSASSSDDDNGHGSHVAGTIGAKDDGTGVTGVAPGADLYSVKALRSNGAGLRSDVICGIDWVTANAASKGIKVANMSLGGGDPDDGKSCADTGDPYKKAICNSTEAGVTYVVAAGNGNKSFKKTVPATYDMVLTVTAVTDFDGEPGGDGARTCLSDKDDTRTDFSNYTKIGHDDTEHTIAAPGACIESTSKSGGYNTMSGTSMASPHVAGAAALCIYGEACQDTDGDGEVAPSEVIAKLRSDAAVQSKSYGFAQDPHQVTATAKKKNKKRTNNLYFGYLVRVEGY